GPPLHRPAGAGHDLPGHRDRPGADVPQRDRPAGAHPRRPDADPRAAVMAVVRCPLSVVRCKDRRQDRCLLLSLQRTTDSGHRPTGYANMAAAPPPGLPPPTPEQRRVAAGQFERANEVLATGNHDYAMQLLLSCCQLDPANLIYRKLLRQTQRAKYGNNLRGGRFALLTTSASRLRMKSAQRGGNHLKVLEHAERILSRNPWDEGALTAM